MADGSIWGIPVEMIARDRAAFYASEFDGDISRSLSEGTIPLFESDDYETKDWALNNMNWSDFNGHQVMLSGPEEIDFQKGWLEGDKGFAEEASGDSSKEKQEPSKFVIHIAGPDDVIEMSDELTALRQANQINMTYLSFRLKKGDDTPLSVATVCDLQNPSNYCQQAID